jgi:hypothetical protein
LEFGFNLLYQKDWLQESFTKYNAYILWHYSILLHQKRTSNQLNKELRSTKFSSLICEIQELYWKFPFEQLLVASNVYYL